MSKKMTFREQLQGLLDDNIEKYPDAVEWMAQMSSTTPLERETRYEKFVRMLSEDYEFASNPYDPDADNIIVFIKWYRGKHGASLRDAKGACEDYILKTYPDCKRVKLVITRRS